jgi:Family of unknown function (DUF6491)
MRPVTISVLAAFCAVSTAAMADNTAPAAAAAKPYPQGITCGYVPETTGAGFGVIDDKHLVVDGVGRKKYLVTLFISCFNLQTSLAIAFERHGTDDLCTGDTIRAGHERCRIQYVEEVASPKEASDIVNARDAAEKANDSHKAGGH